MSFNIEAHVTHLCEQLAENAVARDKTGGHATHERELIRDSGLLTLAIPTRFGGLGQNWHTTLNVVRRVAEVDSSMAHLFAFQHLQVATIMFFGSEQQQAELLTQTVQQRWFWGNALNPADNRSRAVEVEAGILVNGLKSFCSGARGADSLLVSAHLESNGKFVVGAIPANRQGVQIDTDWDAIGQRQTDSGTVRFSDVLIEHDNLLLNPGPNGSPFANLRACLAQSILINIYLGLAQGAYHEARHFTRTRRRPWVNSGVSSAAQDPYLLQRFADLWLQLRTATVFADLAADKLDAAWLKQDALTDEARGEVAVAMVEAKILAHRASLDISSQLFDVAGAGATHSKLGLDRFWRNARTHTLHDPLDYKLRDLGNWALNDVYPTPTSYS
ncbi:MAG: acyl-CoA dehydrogenase family protein [Gallionella sp.]|nr:acyl-CoA dehydrogenase family protein [Gallionella sp.]MDD4958818.1 acyl-CoA dehydrogenase family protein [Gallionella sp.]